MQPVRPSRVTQPFADPGSYASRSDHHGPAGHHTGIDIGAAWPIPIAGRRVRSVLPGRVVISEHDPIMGNWVGVYSHDENLLVTYWHMAERRVRVGDWIQAYDVVGRVGSTGNSTAPHLHVQVNRGMEFDYHAHIHPATAFKVLPRRAARKLFRRFPRHPQAR